MAIKMVRVTKAGSFVASFRAEHVDTADRLRYELAACMGVHGPSVLRGHVTEFSDGTRMVFPVGTDGKRLPGRPYGIIPYDFTPGEA